MKRLVPVVVILSILLIFSLVVFHNASTEVVYGDEGDDERARIMEEARANQKALDESEIDQQIIAALQNGASADEIKQMFIEYETERTGRPFEGIVHVSSNLLPPQPGVIDHGPMTSEEAEQLENEADSGDAPQGSSQSTTWIQRLCQNGAYQRFGVTEAGWANAKLYAGGLAVSNNSYSCDPGVACHIIDAHHEYNFYDNGVATAQVQDPFVPQFTYHYGGCQ